MRDLEDGRLGLEDALARYEHGVGLIKRCYAPAAPGGAAHPAC